MFETIIGNFRTTVGKVTHKQLPPKEKELIDIINEMLRNGENEIFRCDSGLSYIIESQKNKVSILIDSNKIRIFTNNNGEHIIDANLSDDATETVHKSIRTFTNKRFDNKFASLNGGVDKVVNELKTVVFGEDFIHQIEPNTTESIITNHSKL